jgi:soluble lytic murein transglycosylase-like protein
MRWQASAIMICTTLICVQAAAESGPQPYPDFTFKRVGLPDPAAGKRINIQIDPEEQRRMLSAVMVPPARPIPGVSAVGPAAPGPYDWFWAQISPRLADKADRFSMAVAAASRSPMASARLQDFQDIVAQHGDVILRATVGTEVSPALVLALISVESSGQSKVVSSAGAVGLMQLIPATASRFKVADSFDPVQNIQGGVAYLNWLMREFDRDPLMVLAAYNAGENAVKNNGGVPEYAETRAYVPRVLAAWSVARGLCLTPPELVTDGCVFAVKGLRDG